MVRWKIVILHDVLVARNLYKKILKTSSISKILMAGVAGIQQPRVVIMILIYNNTLIFATMYSAQTVVVLTITI